MKPPPNLDAEPARDLSHLPDYVVVLWVSEQLRHKFQRNAIALWDISKPTDAQISAPEPDQRQADREAEP